MGEKSLMDNPIIKDLQRRELALSRELLGREEDDPLKLFEPHPKQKAFIDSVLKQGKSENWMIAANRSGKSDAGAFVGSSLARFGWNSGKIASYGGGERQYVDRSTSGWVSSVDFPTSRDVIEPKYFDNGFVAPNVSHAPFIPEREIEEWRATDRILKLKNGSLIGFKSADSGRKKYQGTEKDWIHFDEEPPKDIYEECVIRVGAKPLHLFGTCTLLPPEGQVGGVSWLFGDIIRPWQQGDKPHVGLFGASIYDNPFIDMGEIRRLEALYPENSTQRRIRLNGEWLAGLGGARVYTSFDRMLHVKAQPLLNLRVPISWCWDFNVEPMVSLICQRDGKIFRVFKELLLEEGNIAEMAEMFRLLHPRHFTEVWIYGDSTGNNRGVQTGISSYTTLLNSMQGYSAPVRLKIPESNPNVGDRINAMNVALMDERGIVGLSIDPSCKDLIADMEQVLRAQDGKIKKTSNRRDPYFRRTHSSDALGYWVAQEAPVVAASWAQQRSVQVPSPQYKFHS